MKCFGYSARPSSTPARGATRCLIIIYLFVCFFVFAGALMVGGSLLDSTRHPTTDRG